MVAGHANSEHPGTVLATEFLEPLGISQYRIAKTVNVPPRRINEIVQGKRSISTDTALRLSRALGLPERYWVDLQASYDVSVARAQIAAELDAIPQLVPDTTAMTTGTEDR